MLDAAVEVFARSGYHAAGVEEIAEISGISKPMVYLYFGSKENLFMACIRRETERLMNKLGQSVETEKTPQDQLRAGLHGFLMFVHKHRQAWSVLYRQARAQGGVVSDDVAQMRSNMVGLIIHLLDNAASDSKEVRDGQIAVAAHALVGASESLADWMLDHPEANPDEVAEDLVRLCWPGLADILS